MGWAERDTVIVWALAKYHTLTSRQLARLTGRGAHLIRRRYRVHLGPAGILNQLASGRTEEAAYCLGPSGRALVAQEQGVDVRDLDVPPGKGVKGLFFAHHSLTRDTLISFELACRGQAPLVCHRVIGEWILACANELRDKDKRHYIYRRFSGTVRCRPDAVVLVSPSEADLQVALAIEADRSTESMRDIRGKLEGYYQLWLRYFNQSSDESYLGAQALRVLFVLGESAPGKDSQPPQRIASMLGALTGFVKRRSGDIASRQALESFGRCFLFARAQELDEQTVLGDIWWNSAGLRTALYRPTRKGQTP